MKVLLGVASFLLLVSGMVKLKAAERVGLGIPILVLGELLAGVAMFGFVLMGDLTAEQGLRLLVGAVVLVLVSSVQVGMAVRRHNRLRNVTEGTRLANYVQYLSRQDSPPE